MTNPVLGIWSLCQGLTSHCEWLCIPFEVLEAAKLSPTPTSRCTHCSWMRGFWRGKTQTLPFQILIFIYSVNQSVCRNSPWSIVFTAIPQWRLLSLSSLAGEVEGEVYSPEYSLALCRDRVCVGVGVGATGTLSCVRNVISRGLILLVISPAPLIPVSLLLFPLTHLSQCPRKGNPALTLQRQVSQ